MTLHGTESDIFNVPALGIRLESTRGIKLSPTIDTFSGIGNAIGATGIITEFVLRIPLNSKVGSSLKSDGTRRDESPTSITGTGTSITSRRLVTFIGDESATLTSFVAPHEWNVRATEISGRVGACCEQKLKLIVSLRDKFSM